MFIIFGTRGRSHTIGTGHFYCPNEGADRAYEHKEARRYFTLFFLPIIPLDRLGDYVECTRCQSTYYTSVLEAPTGAAIQDVMTQAIRHVAVAMTVVDGAIDPAERDVATDVVKQFATVPYDAADFDADLNRLDPANLVDSLEELGGILNDHGKEAVLHAAMRLAASDNSIDPAEVDLVEQIGGALSMTRAHVRGVIETAMARL